MVQQVAAPAAPQAVASAPPVQPAATIVPPVAQSSAVPAASAEPDDLPPPIDDDPPFLQPELRPAPQQTVPAAQPAVPKPTPRKAEPARSAGPLEPFGFWPAVLSDLEENDAMLISFLRGTKAYCDGKRVLFECSDAFRDYIRSNREVSKRLEGSDLPAFPKPSTASALMKSRKPRENGSPAVSLDETLHTMQALGVDLKIIDK